MIKVISIMPTEKEGTSRVVFQNVDKLGLGKVTLSLHSEVANTEKITAKVGDVIEGLKIKSNMHDTPQWTNKKTGEVQKGFEITDNAGKKATKYFTTELIEA